jgi:hypothetical protein
MKPFNRLDFIICGVQKSGTQLISYYLKKHPEIFMPENEIHYFDHWTFKKKIDFFYFKYHKKFNSFKNTNKKIYGEKSPIYIFYKDCMKRIYNYNKNIKIILIFRDPFDRALSQYNMELKREHEYLNFDEAILNETERIKISDFAYRSFSYLNRGYYYKQLVKCYKFFNKEQVLILSYEELLNNFKKTMDKIQTFLGCAKITYTNHPERISWEIQKEKNSFKKSTKDFFVNKLLQDYYNFKKLTKIKFQNFENQ